MYDGDLLRLSARGEVLAVRASFFDAVLVVLPCTETLWQDLHLMPVCSRPTNGSLAFIDRAALHAPKATFTIAGPNCRVGWKRGIPDLPGLGCPGRKADLHTLAARIAARRRGWLISPSR